MKSARLDLRRLWLTLDARFWFVAGLGTLIAVVVLGVPTAVIPNPLFTRMTPTETPNVLTLAVSAPLMGLITASYLAKPAQGRDPHGTGGEVRVSAGGIGAFLAIGCPICNKIVVGLLGVSGALNLFAPLQPLIGVASVGLLGASLIWRLRQRARNCVRCAVGSTVVAA